MCSKFAVKNNKYLRSIKTVTSFTIITPPANRLLHLAFQMPSFSKLPRLPACMPRHFIHIYLGTQAQSTERPLRFLYDTGATPTCINQATYDQAQKHGAVRPFPQGSLNVTTAEGHSMSTEGSFLLTMTLSDGFTFETPVQLNPLLDRPGLIGQNVLTSDAFYLLSLNLP